MKKKVTKKSKQYRTVVVSAGTILRRGGKYLLVQESKPVARGKWNWPAGRVEVGDTIKQTALKEVREETGFRIKLQKRITIFNDDGDGACNHLFYGTIVSGSLRTGDDMMDAQWFSLADIKKMKRQLRHRWVLDGIKLLEKK